MLANQHSVRPAVSTRELTKIFLSVLMITGAISFAYAMGSGTTTGPAATQTSEAAGAASVSAVADAGTAELEYLQNTGQISPAEYQFARSVILIWGGTGIALAVISGSPTLSDAAKNALIGCSAGSVILTSCAEAW